MNYFLIANPNDPTEIQGLIEWTQNEQSRYRERRVDLTPDDVSKYLARLAAPAPELCFYYFYGGDVGRRYDYKAYTSVLKMVGVHLPEVSFYVFTLERALLFSAGRLPNYYFNDDGRYLLEIPEVRPFVLGVSQLLKEALPGPVPTEIHLQKVHRRGQAYFLKALEGEWCAVVIGDYYFKTPFMRSNTPVGVKEQTLARKLKENLFPGVPQRKLMQLLSVGLSQEELATLGQPR